MGQLDVPSIESLRAPADRAARAFQEALADICVVRSAEGVITEIGNDGRIVDVWGEVPLEQLPDRSFGPAIEDAPGGSANQSALTSFTLSCDVLVQEERELVTLPNGLDLHYHSGLHTLIGDPVRFGAAYVSVAAEVDPWLDAPLHGGRFLDNRITAALNRPRLERALRRWESAFGRTISEISSVPYPALVDRYGFRPGGEPDPS
ncbi:MAG: hypothetical protein M3072_17865 [Candidatus Dormibacteraeota bacterium]|nr:hypothetical protein [Candidatus Dormibacteraeota bacterium]